MTIFNWFRKGQKKITDKQVPSIDHDLFVETAAPPQEAVLNLEEDQPIPRKQVRVQQRPTAVSDFLNRDFWQLGYDHAVQFPTNDRKQSALSRLRTDYRFALQQAEQVLRTDSENHQQEMTRVGGISEVIDRQMELRNAELNALHIQVTRQLELSVDDEGWLAPVVAAYHDGFVVGTMEYMRTSELLGGITALK